MYRHGRDHKLRVWRIRSSEEEELLSRVLPVERSKEMSSSDQADQSTTSSPEPWLLHSLPVNALNFCAFTLCLTGSSSLPSSSSERNTSLSKDVDENDETSKRNENDAEFSSYFAVPNALNSGAIDVFHLPSERRVSTIPADTSVQTGMVMAVKLLMDHKNNTQNDILYMLSGYEDGHVTVHAGQSSASGSSQTWKWVKVYASRPHSQPVLSLDSVQMEEEKKEGNRNTGYFFTSSADALLVKHPIPSISSSNFAQTRSQTMEKTPLNVLNTRHSGQQGLRVRGDQKIFATAGWDSRIRVYSCKTMKELAVLKWHSEGCYAVAFAEILNSTSTTVKPSSNTADGRESSSLVQTSSPLEVVRQQRNQKAQQTHWLAAGSKDGKISLWDIY